MGESMVAPLHERIIRLPFRLLSTRAAFDHYYRARSWGPQEESISGPASSLERTAAIRRALPELLRELKAASLLDVPCGDFHWMQHVELPVAEYTGADIVEEMVHENQRRYARPRGAGLAARRFITLDLTSDRLPRADVVLCRDCLVHLSLRKVRRAIENIIASGSRWLLATTFPGAVQRNRDVLTGGWRMLDLTLSPFDFPAPAREIDEEWPEWPARRLGLWRIADLPSRVESGGPAAAMPRSGDRQS
jgi:SAM-dependent methyltransferase